MSNEMMIQAQETELAKIDNSPKAVVARATEAAKELQKIVDSRKKKLVLQGKQYLFFEDWQTLGKFDNITAKVVSTEEVYVNGKFLGFKARAVAIKNGEEISAGEAECCVDEPNWRNKPRFQLKSMAQTRACGKALRNCLAFIAVLANYEPTPAEEMEDMSINDNNVSTVKPTIVKPAPVAKSNPVNKPVVNPKSEPNPENDDGSPMTPAQRGIFEKQFLVSDYLLNVKTLTIDGTPPKNGYKGTLISEREYYQQEFAMGNITKKRAIGIIGWWLGDSQKGIEGERTKREKNKIKSNLVEAGLIEEKKKTPKQEEIIALARDAGIQSPKQLIENLSTISYKDMDGQDATINPKTSYQELLGMIEHNDDFYERAKEALGGNSNSMEDIAEPEEEL